MPASVAEPAERLFSTELQERLTGYPGQWAAVLNDEIVAVAETPKEAYDMGREAVLERRHPADWSRRTELVLPDEQAAKVDPLVGVHDELRLARLARQKQQGKSV